MIDTSHMTQPPLISHEPQLTEIKLARFVIQRQHRHTRDDVVCTGCFRSVDRLFGGYGHDPGCPVALAYAVENAIPRARPLREQPIKKDQFILLGKAFPAKARKEKEAA